MLTQTTEAVMKAKRGCAAAVVYSLSMHQQPGTNFTSRPEINLDWRCGP